MKSVKFGALLVLALLSLASRGAKSVQASKPPSMQAKVNFEWFKTFLSVVLKLGSTVVDGVCLDVNKQIQKTVWIYNVEVDIQQVCLTSVSFEKLGDDFYKLEYLDSSESPQP